MGSTTKSKIVNQLMNKVANYLYDTYSYMGSGTGTDDFSDSGVNLTAGVTIQSASFRKERDNTNTGSFVSNNDLILLFNLDPGEPVSQPVLLGEVGLFENNGTDGSMGIGATLYVTQTKDNLVKQRWRLGIHIARISEVLE